MFVIVVSNIYGNSTTHGLWHDKELAELVADRWRRAFERRGWNLRVSVLGMLGKSAGVRDQFGAMLADMADRAREDELRRVDAQPCECEGLDVVPGSVGDLHPDGLCTCGHEPEAHSGEGCDDLVLPALAGIGRS